MTSSNFSSNVPSTTAPSTLSLHDALPISLEEHPGLAGSEARPGCNLHGHHLVAAAVEQDRKSTRLNSSHQIISYAVFCLKKKRKLSTAGDLVLERLAPYMLVR